MITAVAPRSSTAPHQAARRAALTACIIGRDNERTVAACLAGLTAWVDQLVFVDTGSTDRTPEIARAHGAEVRFFPWIDDFAAARNASLAYARGDWIFWIDTDDTLDVEQGRRLRRLVDGPHSADVLGYVFPVRCPRPTGDGACDVTVVDHVKLFRNRSDLRFEGRIHEQILPAIRRAGGRVEFADVTIEHSGADHTPEGRRRKLDRDLRILRLDLAERPEHPFVLFNLGMTYADAGEHRRAVEYLRRSLAVAQPGESQVRKAHAILVGSLTALGDFAAAEAACAAGRAAFPHDPELMFRQALLAQEQGRHAQAAAGYRQLLGRPDEPHFSSLDVGILGPKTRHNLALAEAARGRPDLAEVQWRRILRDHPEQRLAWRGLSRQLLAEGRAASLTTLVRRAAALPVGAAEGPLLRARRAWAQGDGATARRELHAALEREPQSTDAWHALAQLEFEQGTPEAAAVVLERLVRLVPSDAAAWHNWGSVLARLGRTAEAGQALRRSLALRPGDQATALDLTTLKPAAASPEPTENGDTHQLPPCAARRAFDVARQRYVCAHPRVGTAGGMVSVEFCRTCRLPDEAPPAAYRDTPPPFPPSSVRCRHLGQVVGQRACEGCRGNVLVKEFACGHPGHGVTTWRECQECGDRAPVESMV